MARDQEIRLNRRIKEIQDQFKKKLGVELSKTQAILAGLSRQGDNLEFQVGAKKRKKKRLVLRR